MQQLGMTRSSYRRDHALITPDTFIRTPLPGWQDSACIVHISPQMGAAFTMYQVELPASGRGEATLAGVERFVYVLEGEILAHLGGKTHSLTQGGYAFFPAGVSHVLEAVGKARLAVYEKPFRPLDGVLAPSVIVGNEADVEGRPLGDDPDLIVRMLLPDQLSYDMAVNTMTFNPGAALPLVEVHVMEHGLLMLQGGGLYRLSDRWYPVAAGDVIYMAPYCPQWFGAIGKQPARYLLYKDANRHPLEQEG
ncbi:MULTISPECIES: (S)-ureidoglycine aminohydrolase [unclassified Meiothermus]|uniref:(S)-ureidoglycine aminohydrolase n=1 Tax=unclassified Meiothermus TaxID=370471 RepID=UPI000D7BEFA9|nr:MULTISPECIES: (S)-ureidoglycine aminohydrolase [unclassified Meiothermus]PZA08410.1 (S)-ureidoglycine aminohydrolase [Meiothermus sp. Pnk-1]RYM37077.1 (S)-ureidoglycine aminohydrolase [Meiothermus sp. PNK-Is4]